MKWVAWLLIVLNIALFGYFRLSEPQVAGIRPGHEPIQPESMKILTPEQVDAMPIAPAVQENTAPPVPEHAAGCYEWGSFPAISVARARNILEKFGLEANVRIIAPQEAVRYWVYIPPRKNMQDAQARIDELRALGIEETFVVQEPQWRYAISLGVFKEEALATRLAEDVRSRGIANVVKAVRNQENGQSVFYLKDVTDSQAAEIGKFKPDFPSSELKPVACQ